MIIESNILFNIAACYNEMKNSEKAVKYAEEVCKLDKKLENKERYAESLLKYSSTLIRNNDYDNAKKVLKEANHVLEEQVKEKTKAYVNNNLGYIYLKSNELDKAFEHLNKAKELKETLQLEDLPTTLYELHKFYLKTGQVQKGLESLEEGINFSREKKLKKYLIYGIRLYVDYYVSIRDFNKAIEKSKELISLLKEVQRKNDLISAYLKYGEILRLSGKEHDALDAFSKAYMLNENE